jgi:multidrug efflux system membrane fusion protein
MSSQPKQPPEDDGKPHAHEDQPHPLGPRGAHAKAAPTPDSAAEKSAGHEAHGHSSRHEDSREHRPHEHQSHEQKAHEPKAQGQNAQDHKSPDHQRHEHQAHDHAAKKGAQKKGHFWTLWFPIIVLVLLVAAWILYKELHKAKPPAAPPAIPVAVTTVKTGNIDVILDALGTVTPVYTVSVTARVTGAITEIDYKEGQLVKKGDLLLVIDPRPYAAAVDQGAGQLARDQAMLANARIDLGRYQDAFKTHAVPEQQVATQEATVKGDEGTVQLDQGNLAAAQVNLDYTQVRSPIDGRVGLRDVDLGNVVSANGTTTLATITQLQPITVIFTVSEDYLDEITPELNGPKPLEVEALDRAQQKQIAAGTLDTLDNQVNTATGTVRARATFANTKNELFPNQFVNAKLHVKTLTNVLLVPTAAIQHNDTAAFVYVVKKGTPPAPPPEAKSAGDKDSTGAKDSKDSTSEKDGKDAAKAPPDPNAMYVKSTPVTITVTEGDRAAVTGVNAGDTLVTDGFEKLQDGTRVAVKKPGAPGKAAPAPEGAPAAPAAKPAGS